MEPTLQTSPTKVKHVVLLLHGIRTQAEWFVDFQNIFYQTVEEKHLKTEEFEVIRLRYGWTNALKFWEPLLLRRQFVNWFHNETEPLRRTYLNAEFSIIAHSFGTYILAEAISERTQNKYKNIILCGSIVNRKFPWFADYSDCFENLDSDCALRDIWPIMSKLFVFFTDASGVFGFEGALPASRFTERFFKGYSHSSFFYAEHYKNVWIPRILGQQPQKSPETKRTTPWLRRFIASFSWITKPVEILLLLTLIYIIISYGFSSTRICVHAGKASELIATANRARDIQPTQAHRLYREAYDLCPQSPRTLNGMGHVEFDAANWAEARTFYEKALSQGDQERWKYAKNIAMTYSREESYGEALKYFQMAESLYGKWDEDKLFLLYDVARTNMIIWQQENTFPAESNVFRAARSKFLQFIDGNGWPRHWAYYHLTCLLASRANDRNLVEVDRKVNATEAMAYLKKFVQSLGEFADSKGGKPRANHHIALMKELLLLDFTNVKPGSPKSCADNIRTLRDFNQNEFDKILKDAAEIVNRGS